MKFKALSLWIFIASIICSNLPQAKAQEFYKKKESTASTPTSRTYYNRPKGYSNIGLLSGRSNNRMEYAGYLGGGSITAGPEVYTGVSQRLEIGTGFGITGYITGGYNVIAPFLDDDAVFIPVAGLEPVNFSYSANTMKRRIDFFEWAPAFALGFQLFPADQCGLLMTAKAVGVVGTLGNDGNADPGMGAQVIVDCHGFGLYATFLRILDGRKPHDLLEGEFVFPIGKRALVLLRGEFIGKKMTALNEPFDLTTFTKNQRIEERGFLSFGWRSK